MTALVGQLFETDGKRYMAAWVKGGGGRGVLEIPPPPQHTHLSGLALRRKNPSYSLNTSFVTVDFSVCVCVCVCVCVTCPNNISNNEQISEIPNKQAKQYNKTAKIRTCIVETGSPCFIYS